MLVSIILVNYNTRGLLLNCLRSIYDQTTEIEFEVILVDNASIDDSVEATKLAFPEVKIIRNNTNYGFAKANNQGIAIAQGKYILLLNTDTVILNRAIEKSIAYMQKNPTADVVGCRLLNGDGSLQPSARSFPGVWNLFCLATFLDPLFKRSRLFGQFDLTWFTYDRVLEVDTVIGAFLLAKRSALSAVGGFDEKFFFNGEESDLCRRMRDEGFKVFFFPGAEVTHYGGGSIRNPLQYFKNLHNSYLRLIRKHYKGPKFLLTLILLKLSVAVRVPLYFIVGLLRGEKEFVSKAWYYTLLLFETAGLRMEQGYRYVEN